ncbi:MAG TPA: MgtC/SapB family protein [Candidatus Binatia bacterium]|nr:MgtC/SapB family protein [Candidatus Binatia bacterium]
MAWQMFMLRVGVAALLGAIIGLERQVRQRLAGLRTNALVSIGAAAFVALAAGRTDRAIEQVVGRLSLEPSVSEALWRIAEADDD